MASNPPRFPTGLALQATTGASGYMLVNGTGNFLTWTPPADGGLHRYMLFAQQIVTVNQVGGELAINFKAVDGTNELQQLSAADLSAGVYGPGSFSWLSGLVQAGQPVVLSQFTALTAGAAKFWCEIWGG
jgi:hypothetical protein